MLDTGAGASLIEEDLFRKVGGKMIVTEPLSIQGVDRTPIPNKGIAEVVVDFGHGEIIEKFVVISQGIVLPTAVLLGLEFMWRQNVVAAPLDTPGQFSVMVGAYPVEVHSLAADDMSPYPEDHKPTLDEMEEVPVKAYAINVASLLPGTAGYVTLEAEIGRAQQALFLPRSNDIPSSFLFPGLVTLTPNVKQTKGKFIIPYANPTEETIEMPTGEVMGHIYSCHSEYYQSSTNECVAAVTKTATKPPVTQSSKQMVLDKLIDELFLPSQRENCCLKGLTRKYPDVFALKNEPLTITPYYVHTLRLKNDKPIYKKPYPIPVKYHKEIEIQLKDLEAQGIIRPSASPYSAPLVPVAKKDGGVRLCLDFRALNDELIDDKHPLPNINLILQQLGESKVFTSLDLRQGYHQVPLAEESKHLTAFTTPYGLYEFTTVPFGLKTAPAAYQRIMNQVLIGLTGRIVHVYLDDLIVQGKDMDHHLKNLHAVLDRLQKAHLSLRLDKCSFFKEQVDYLGHIVSASGLKPQPSKVQAVQQLTPPKTVKELQGFLGLVNFYRKFIKDFAKIASPLNNLLKGRKVTKNDKTHLEWNEEALHAFSTLKNSLTTDIVLAFPDFRKPFNLTTDASDKAIGGVLQQKDENGSLRPIAYFSRTLNGAERNYSAVEREALAVIYGLSTNRPLILGYRIHILSDHRPLTWLLKSTVPSSRIARWQTLLGEFDFSIDYLPGSSNMVADFLSRIRNQESDVIEGELDARIMSVTLTGGQDMSVASPEGHDKQDKFLHWSLAGLMEHQDRDPELRELKHAFEQTTGGNVHERDERKVAERSNVTLNAAKRHFKKLPLSEVCVENGILYRDVCDEYNKQKRLVIVPPSYIPNALALAHSMLPAGHGGTKVTLARCRKFAYWPGMKADVEQYVRSCPVCCRFKKRGSPPAPLMRYPEVGQPFDRVHMDIVGPLSVSDEGYRYVLTVIDVLSRFLVATPLRTKAAKEVAAAFYKNVVCVHSIPPILVTDQGKEFVNTLLRELTQLLQIDHLRTTPYHPSANGVIERPNGTLINILRTLCEDNRGIWDQMLPVATHAYNTAYHRVLKDSPFFLLFSRDPNVPFEVLENKLQPCYDVDSYKAFTSSVAQRTYKLCQTNIDIGWQESERMFRKSKPKQVVVGDRVYLRHVCTKGEPKKLQPLFNGPFRVLEKISPVVLRLRHVRGGKIKTVHTNNVQVVHEDSLGFHDSPNVRRAYPLPDQVVEVDPLPMTYSPEEPLPLSFPAPSELSSPAPVSSDASEVPSLVPSAPSEPCVSRSLRSNTVPPSLPNVMERPLEYRQRPTN